jgi:carbon-monoxide dehydrogenase medium subunit
LKAAIHFKEGFMNEFDFFSPENITSALRAISPKGLNYKLLAGGTNLIPYIREESARPNLVIDLSKIQALRYITEEKGLIRIGALTTISDLLDSKIIKNRVPLLWKAAGQFAGPVVRNRATVGGNLADASPAADSAIPLLALQAQVKLRSIKGQRTVRLEDFFTGYRQTVLKPGEILCEISFPIPGRDTKYAYHKMGRRNAMAISVVSVAVLLKMSGKKCQEAAIALGAVAPTPIRSREAEALLGKHTVDVDLARSCGEAAAQSVTPIDDMRASAEYRRNMCVYWVREAIVEGAGLQE